MTKTKQQTKPAKPAETAPAPKADANTDAAPKAAPSRFRIFLFDAVIAILAFIAVRGAAAKICDTYAKVRWAFEVIGKIDQLGPDYAGLLPPLPDSGRKGGKDLAGWIRQNVPRSAAAEYRKVGEIFQATADKLRSGALDGKREAYADTAREIARSADRAAWGPFLTALAARNEAEKAETNTELAELFETAGKAIAREAAAPAEEGAPRIE